MLRHIINRVILIFVTIVIIITLLFFSIWLAMIEKYYGDVKLLEFLPFIWSEFVIYFTNIVTKWDWGYSNLGDPAWPIVFEKVHYTLTITIASLIFFVTGGLVLGTIAGMNKNTWIDKLISTLSTILSSLPSFIAVWLLMLSLGWGLKVVPSLYPVGTTDPIVALKGLVIPVLALSLWPLSKIIQLVRGEIADAMHEEYLLLARTKGLTKLQCILRHASKNAIVAIFPEISNSFLFVLGSSFLVEIIYNIQGVANLFYDNLIVGFGFGNYVNINIPIAILVAVFYMSFALVFSLVIDILNTLIDPRIKIGSKSFKQVYTKKRLFFKRSKTNR